MTARIQFRRDTAATWAAASPSPVLAVGEVGFETDTLRFKIGDGSTPWTSLQYPTDTIPYLPSTGLTDLNNITKTGRYRFSSASGLSNIPTSAGSGTDAEPVRGAYTASIQYGIAGYTDGGALLLVIRYDTKLSGSNAGDFIYQELTTDGAQSANTATTPDIPSKKWFRLWDGDVSAWTDWTPTTVWATISNQDTANGTNPTSGVDVRCRELRASSAVQLWGTGSDKLQFKGKTGNGTNYRQWSIDYLDNNGLTAGNWDTAVLRIQGGDNYVYFGSPNITGGGYYDLMVGPKPNGASFDADHDLLVWGSGQFCDGLTVGAANNFNGGGGATRTATFWGLIDAKGAVTSPTIAMNANGLRIQNVNTAINAVTDAMNLQGIIDRISFAVFSAGFTTATGTDGIVWTKNVASGTTVVVSAAGGNTYRILGLGFNGANVQAIGSIGSANSITLTGSNPHDAHVIIAFRTNVP